MARRNETVSNANNSTITNTETHDTGYQLINGVAITPELIQRIEVMQEDCNEAITMWEACAMRLICDFMICSDGNLDNSERAEHIWTICNLVKFMKVMQAPDEFILERFEEERRGK